MKSKISWISTYKYENCLRLLGLEIKHGYRPLEQVSRRCIEKSQHQKHIDLHDIFEPKEYSPKVFYEKIRESIITWDKIQISPDFALSNRKTADSWFITKSDEIVRIMNHECPKRKK